MGTLFGARSPFARPIGDLFLVTLVVCALVFALVSALVAYSTARHRGRAGEEEPAPVFGHTKLEVVWTLVPVGIVTALTVLSIDAMRSSDPAPSRAPDVVVIGHQWWWEARYASGVVTANELHVPVGASWL